jgi:ribosomal protein S18 acetylase RimI-like enzyme
MKRVETTIRAYEASTDLEKLSAIWFEASLLAHPFIGEERLREQRILIETKYLPDAETWVACRDDEPVGFVSLLGQFIGGLFVAPGQQGHGIGRTLVAHALELKGELVLEVYTSNGQALAFYQSLGFKEQSRRAEDDEGMPFENVQMLLRA